MESLVGQKYGKLTVESFVKTIRYKRGGVTHVWSCRCSCDRVIEVRQGNLLSAKNPKCKKCASAEFHDVRLKTPITSAIWLGIKWRCQYRNIELAVTPEYLYDLYVKQQGRCAISKVPICFATSHRTKNETTASVDRIDSSIGYVEGNVQWVHKIVNSMKNSMSLDELIEWCRLIFLANKGK